jgi:hypothetical protein
VSQLAGPEPEKVMVDASVWSVDGNAKTDTHNSKFGRSLAKDQKSEEPSNLYNNQLRDIFQTSPETSLTHRKIAEMGGKSATKAVYFDKLKSLLETYKSIFIVTVDNVSSQQMHEIRQALRGDSVVLMGKNTMVRRALKGFIADAPEYERLLPHVKGEFACASIHNAPH